MLQATLAICVANERYIGFALSPLGGVHRGVVFSHLDALKLAVVFSANSLSRPNPRCVLGIRYAKLFTLLMSICKIYLATTEAIDHQMH